MSVSSARAWAVSPYNLPQGELPQSAPRSVTVHDCTIREGEQQPGVHMTMEQRRRVVAALEDAGVQQIEVAIPGYSTQAAEITRVLASAGFGAHITVVCRASRQEVDAAADNGAWGALCSIPAGDMQLRDKARLSDEEAIARAVDTTQYAHERGLYVIFSMADTARGRLEFVDRLVRAVVSDGYADRVRVVDTAGGATPAAMAHLVSHIKQVVDRPVEVHCHNDFGLATANTLSAVLAGAEVVSTSVGGVGPRAGNAPTEEVALALQVLYGIDAGLRLDRLAGLGRIVEECTGFHQAPHKPVTGRNLMELSDIARIGSDENPLVSQSYLPELVGLIAQD